MTRYLALILVVSTAIACADAEPKSNTGTDVDTNNDAGTQMDSGGNTTTDGGGMEPTAAYDIVVEEVNIGDEVEPFSGAPAVASEDFGATVSEGRLSIEVDQEDLRLVIGIDTTQSNTLPGQKSTDSNFSDETFVSLDIGNSFWDLQGGGTVDFLDCPAGVGSTVSVELQDVRLASSISQSIKEVSGDVTVEVVESDGSVVCAE